MTLHEAVQANNISVVQRKLSKGASPRQKNLHRKSAMDIAKEMGNKEMIQILEEAAGRLGVHAKLFLVLYSKVIFSFIQTRCIVHTI